MSFATEEFQKRLEKWLEDSKPEDGRWIESKRSTIPPMLRGYNDTLYRGMSVGPDFLNLLNEGKMVFKNPTSWSKSEVVAKKFIDDPKYKMVGARGNIKILISKKVPANIQVLDVHMCASMFGVLPLVDELALDSALKEQEVLVGANLPILVSDVKFL